MQTAYNSIIVQHCINNMLINLSLTNIFKKERNHVGKEIERKEGMYEEREEKIKYPGFFCAVPLSS